MIHANHYNLIIAKKYAFFKMFFLLKMLLEIINKIHEKFINYNYIIFLTIHIFKNIQLNIFKNI